MTEKSHLQTMFDAWGDMNSVFTYFRKQLNEECTAFLTKWTANPPVGLPDQTDLWSEENVEFMSQTDTISLSRKERFYYIATGLLNGGDGEHDWIFIPMLHDDGLIKVAPMIVCLTSSSIQNVEVISLDFDNPKTRKEFVTLAHGDKTLTDVSNLKEPAMTKKSNLQNILDNFGDMNPIFADYRQQLNEECTAFLAKWTIDPPVDLPDRTDLWSEENVEFMGHQGMHLIPKKAQFYYIATGLLNGGDGEHDWIFIPMLHDERHIEINIMIACPAMDNVQNIEAMRSTFHYPKVRADFIALAHGKDPFTADMQ